LERNRPAIIHGPSLLTAQDVRLFRQGRHFRLYEKLGAHPFVHDRVPGTLFAVWAPNAASVSVIGDFNGWNAHTHPLAGRWDESGIWEGFVPGLGPGALYKYHVVAREDGAAQNHIDPVAFRFECPPGTASKVWGLEHAWQDDDWMARRLEADAYHKPLAAYEVHAGSWRHRAPGESLSWNELADELVAYVADTGFTHVEFMPVMEHPFYASWGYQVLGYFAPTARHGTPQEFMRLVDRLHRAGIGVILDWVPAHFPDDAHGLARFDGTCLYEHEDPRRGVHPDWHTRIFNYGRNEVRSFLGSSALFWLDRYHADGLRVDAVASMLYLDYSRADGEWLPNRYGGKENLEAVDFLRDLNRAVYHHHPGTCTIAEESTAWPMVSRPVDHGGLGFGYKWNLGWMHDTLSYLARDPVHRKHHQDQLTFGTTYAFGENYVLPLSHDEVVHGKRSLFEKLPGDDRRKAAQLRLLFGWQYLMPGKKLLFMGSEFGQRVEWNHDRPLDWHLLENDMHAGILRWVRDLNRIYRAESALHELDHDPAGFRWVDCGDAGAGVFSFLRLGRDPARPLLVVAGFTPVPRTGYRIGIPAPGRWQELLNSDADPYGGDGQGNLGVLESNPVAMHGFDQSLSLNLPPFGILLLKPASDT
jgi:1,4-alpha-glucan branching enzyme